MFVLILLTIRFNAEAYVFISGKLGTHVINSDRILGACCVV